VDKRASTLVSLRSWARPEISALFVTPAEASRARARVLTIDQAAPPEVAQALREAKDPRLATRELATTAKRPTLRESEPPESAVEGVRKARAARRARRR